ncbi:putative membrane protein, partial [Vibrio parahaemolyticus VP-48]
VLFVTFVLCNQRKTNKTLTAT